MLEDGFSCCASGNVGVGAGATGLVGMEVVGVMASQPRKHSDVQKHLMYSSMNDQQLPQLAAHVSIWLHASDVISSHVASSVRVSSYTSKQPPHPWMSRPPSCRHPAHAASSDGHLYPNAGVGAGAGAAGATGLEALIGEEWQDRKQSDPHVQVSYASMYAVQVPQLLVQASVRLQTRLVSSPHVVSLLTESVNVP